LSFVALNLLFPPPLWAIPSPDLVVNFFASAAQVLGLLTITLGGLAYSASRRPGTTAGRLGRSWRWLAGISLGLLGISLAANVLQYTDALDAKYRRLEVNITRPSLEEGRQVGDVDLKELPYSDQVKHSAGITTADLERWMAEGRPLNIIDTREPEEIEMGRIQGALDIRYPDLRREPSKLVSEGKETVLLCFNGNRSSELCNEFAKDGYPCRFMVGGYEKWIAEGRDLSLARARKPGEIRDIPEYPNKDTLLDTPDVLELVANEQAIFVDVRYPGEFERHHLPGAINVTMRKMTSDELWAQLKSLPRRPIIAPAYDRRSSFFALILGLRLSRLGYDYRGRYTVPYEFSLPRTDKPYVAKWKAAQEKETLLGLASAPLQTALEWLNGRLGHLGLAVLILVFVLRLLLLPSSLKAERDQILERRMAPTVKALKDKLGADPPRFARAVRGLYRREGLTPVRNLAGTLLQIVVFLVFFFVVSRAAEGSRQSFLWIRELGSPDPFYLLPAIVAVAMVLYLWLSTTRRAVWTILLIALAGALLFGLTFWLPAAVNLYLAFNVALLLGQSVATRAYLERTRGRQDGAAVAPGPGKGSGADAVSIVPLKMADRAPGAGNKAVRLAIMMQAGLPVPDGFVVTDGILSRGNGGPLDLSPDEARAIERAWSRIGSEKVAVRSSGLDEDGTRLSYAGMFESSLDVGREQLLDALETVRASLTSHRASSYGGVANGRGGILVQKMVNAEYAGVFFTEHPTSAGCSVVELASGLGDALARGSITPDPYCFGRLSGRPLDARKPPLDLGPLLTLGRRAEDLFGTPQDIEWAYAGGRFFILQSRDITASVRDSSSPRGAMERERHRLLGLASGAAPDEVVFGQNELSELLPRPTPLSLSIVERLWASGGSTDLACRALGIPYLVEEDSPPYVTTVFGALYVNRREEGRRLKERLGPLAAFRLSRSAERIGRHFHEEFLPTFLEEARLREAIDCSRLSATELVSLLKKWTDRFVAETYVEAEIVNLAADVYMKTALERLRKRGLDPVVHLATMPETVVHQALSMLPAIRAGRRGPEEFLELFGHRAPQDYELSQPRYRESPALLTELVNRAREGEPTGDGASENGAKHEPRGRVLTLALERARSFQVLKEEAKHHCLRELATLRLLLLELDRRLGLDGGIFFLTIDEALRLGEGDFQPHARDLVDRRRTDTEAWRSLEFPTEVTTKDLEGLGVGRAGEGIGQRRDVLRGARVSGDKEVQGRVRVVRHQEEIDSVRSGEILVARFTDPAWTPLFPRLAGLITEVGGWLSHAAIVAREYNLPAIVGASGALGILKTGSLVRMRIDGGIEQLAPERRGYPRAPMPARVVLLLRDQKIFHGLLRDLSETGALVEVGEALEEGQGIGIRISPDGEAVRAEVVRRDPSGGYGLAFERPLEGLPPDDARS
jgi:YidC/Oxa1 family membrane protein insertase